MMTRIFIREKRGEIAAALTLLSLATIILGIAIGSQDAVRKVFTRAAGDTACYTKRCSPSASAGTALSCPSDLECKDLSRTPFARDYRCVQPGVNCTAADGADCWCAGTVPPAPQEREEPESPDSPGLRVCPQSANGRLESYECWATFFKDPEVTVFVDNDQRTLRIKSESRDNNGVCVHESPYSIDTRV